MQNQITGKIPLTVIVTMVIQTVATIWWMAKLDLRVQIHDKLIEHGFMEKVLVLEERVKNLSEELNEFTSQVLNRKFRS
jgi:beta-galactosidase GanA